MSSRSVLLVLVILACLQCFTTANHAHGPGKCCFTYKKNEIEVQTIKDFNKTARQCTKPGVIFILNDGHQVCADSRVEWVKKRMEQIKEMNKLT